MVGRGKAASSVVSTLTYLLQKIWSEWDVRGMVLLSLLLQITLWVLGKRRNNSIGPISRMILWFAYISADWVAIAALGKLSNARALSPTKNVLRALWAPILIMHLGGPDTITAYTLQDTQLWKRHILTLVVQSIFAIYVIYLSWTYLRLSILTIPLILAGIIKYVERILCLELTDSVKTEPVIPVSSVGGIETAIFLDHLLKKDDSLVLLLGYLLFSLLRPDVIGNISNSMQERQFYLLGMKAKLELPEFSHQMLVLRGLLQMRKLIEHPFEIAAVEMGFTYSIIYTKSSFIYTKKGCVLRVVNFTCSCLVLLFFLFSIMNEPKFHFSSVDIHITISLLVGAVALELFAVYSMFSSLWTIPLMLFHENRLLCKILWYAFKYFPRFLFPQRKEWSRRMGQFNLLDHYWNCSHSKAYTLIEKYFSSRILEYLHKNMCTKFVEVPSCLKVKEDYLDRLDSFLNGFSFEPTRGQKTLDKIKGNASLHKSLKEIIEMDFDTSIIVWHLATSVCYYQDVQHPYQNVLIEDKKSSKYLSDYMMYLLFFKPAMLVPERHRSFWLENACDQLKDIFSKASNMEHALTLLLNLNDPDGRNNIRNPDALNVLRQYTSNLVMALNSAQIWGRWKIMKEMWIEMLLYAAHSCQHVNHIKQLAQSDLEFLTLIWVMMVSFIEADTLNIMGTGARARARAWS